MVVFVSLLTSLLVCLEALSSDQKDFFLPRDLKGCRISTSRLFPFILVNGITITPCTNGQGHIQQDYIIPDYTCILPANQYFTFCNISILHDSICWNATSKWRERFICGIIRRSFRGGLRSFDISCYSILPPSCHLSLQVFEKRTIRKLYSCVDIAVYVEDYRIQERKQVCCRIFFRGKKFVAQENYFSKNNCSIKLSCFEGLDTMTFSSYLERKSSQTFQVPNHSKATMKRRLLHSHPKVITEDNTKKPFYRDNYFESQITKKYTSLLSFINKHLKPSLKTILTREPKKMKSSHKTLNYVKYKNKPPYEDKLHNFMQSTQVNQHFNVKKLLVPDVKKKGILSSMKIKKLKNGLKNKEKPLKRKLRSIQSSKDDSTLRLKVRFSLEKSVTQAQQANEEFRNHLKKQLAKRMRVPVPCIQSMTINAGTDVSFTISIFNDKNNAMDDQSVFDAADFLKKEINDQRLRLTDLNGQLLMTVSGTYASMDDTTVNFSVVILIVLSITVFMLLAIAILVMYIARRVSRAPKPTLDTRNTVYRNMDFGRDSSQSVGKYSYDSGLWLGPGSEPILEVPEAPYYRPPTVDQISSTPRPITAVRTRLKRNWNVDERALSTIPDDLNRAYVQRSH